MAASKRADDLTLRERKAAQTRLAFLDATTELMKERPFAEISIRELCRDVGVSEPTFHKYFSTKHELLVFYVWLWSIEVACRMELDGGTAFERLSALFTLAAERIQQSPRVMHEIIAYQVRLEGPPRVEPPTLAEKVLRFPEFERAPEQQPAPINELLGEIVETAIGQGELPEETDRSETTRLLMALFFGAPAAEREPQQIAQIYRRGLATLWRGLGGTTKGVSQ